MAGAQAVCVFGNDLLDAACLRLVRQASVRLVALRCSGFNDVDLAAAKSLGLAVIRVRYAEFDALLAASDVLSLHLPLTPQTRHVLNAETFARLKPGAFLINTSRCKLVDTTALITALKSGRLGGVALDDYEEEEGIFFDDLSDKILQDDELSRLLTFPNVLTTAHQAFLAQEALGEIARVTTANVLRFETGEPFLAGTTLRRRAPALGIPPNTEVPGPHDLAGVTESVTRQNGAGGEA